MIGKTLMTAAFALAAAGTVPALAQSTTAGAPDPTRNTSTQNPGMSVTPGSTTESTMPTMTKSQTAAWKKCQAMPEAKMMKNKSCMKMSKMQGMNHDAM